MKQKYPDKSSDWTFHGGFNMLMAPKIKKVVINRPVVVAVWEDGERTRATCSKEDTFDPEVGLAVCMRKKILPEKQFARVLRRAVTIKA